MAGGRKLHYHYPLSGQLQPQGLNSHSGLPSRRWLSATVLVSLLGAHMGNPLQQARAEEARLDRSPQFQQFQRNVQAYETAFDGFATAYQKFSQAITLTLAARSAEFGDKPISTEDKKRLLSVTPYDCPKEAQALFAAVDQLNKAAEPFIGKGKILIPVSGKDMEGKFQSMLDWLNADWSIGESKFKAVVPPFAALDQASMQALYDRLSAANVEVSAQRASMQLALLGAPPARAAESERPASEQPQRETEADRVEAERKARLAATPRVAEPEEAEPAVARDPMAQLKYDLDVLGSHPNRSIRTQADKLVAALRKDDTNQKTVKAAKSFVAKSKKSGAYKRAAGLYSEDTSSLFAVEGKLFGDFSTHPLRSDSRYQEILKSSDLDLKSRLTQMWKIGDHARHQYLDVLYTAFKATDPTEKKAKLEVAEKLLKSEFAFNTQLLERAKELAEQVRTLSAKLKDEKGQPSSAAYTFQAGMHRSWLKTNVKSPPAYSVVAYNVAYLEQHLSALQAVLSAADSGDHALYLQARTTLLKMPKVSEVPGLGVAVSANKPKEFSDAKLAAYKSLTVKLSTQDDGLRGLAALRAFRNIYQNVSDGDAQRFLELALEATATTRAGESRLSIATPLPGHEYSPSALVNAALGLAAIAELDLAIKTNSAQAKDADLDTAKKLLERAKMEFQMAFGNGEILPTYHSNTAVSFAEAGLRAVYPDSKLEAQATYVILNAGDNPISEKVKKKGIEGALAAASVAGERYFTLLSTLTANGIASSSPFEHYTVARDVPKSNGSAEAFELSPSRRTEGLPLNSDLHSGVEPRNYGHRYYGVAYQEYLTQSGIHARGPESLRPIALQFEQLMASSTSETGGLAVVQNFEQQRLEQLRTRLSGSVMIDGKAVPISVLEKIKHPNVGYIVRAREILAVAGEAVNDGKRSSFAIRANIRALENAVESLDEGNLNKIPIPKEVVKPPVRAQVYVPEAAIDINRERSYNQTRVRFTVNYVMDDNKRVDTATLKGNEYTFYWFIYQSLGGRDATGQPVLYLLNPMYSDTTQPRYLGVIYRNVTLEDGKKGDFMIRVARSHLAPSPGNPEWKPMVQLGGKVALKDVLYELKPGTAEPIRDDRLAATMTAFENDNKSLVRLTKSPTTAVVEYGETIPVVAVRKTE